MKTAARWWGWACALLALGLLSCSQQGPQPPVNAGDVERCLVEARYGEATGLARELLADREKRCGPVSMEVAAALDLLAEALRRAGRARSEEALEVARRALALKGQLLPAGDPGCGRSLHNLGALFCRRGDYARAERFLERASAAYRCADPPDPALVDTLLLQADVQLYLQADEEKARALLEEAGALAHTGRARARWAHHLGKVLYLTGDYARARQSYLEALELEREAFPAGHPFPAATHNNLGLLLAELGHFRAARQHLEAALAIRRSAYGGAHPNVARTLLALGELLEREGEWKRARSCYQEARGIWVRAGGPMSLEVAWALTHLGRLLLRRGEVSGAERALLEARAVIAAGPEPDAETRMETLCALGKVYLQGGHCDQAVECDEKALRVCEKQWGEGHYLVAQCLDELGLALEGAGRLEPAQECFEKAERIYAQVCAEAEQPDSARSRARAARLEAKRGFPRPAFERALRSEAIGRKHLRETARYLPEAQALKYAAVRAGGLHLALALAGEHPVDFAGQGARLWDAVIRSRALLLEEMVRRRRMVAAGGRSGRLGELAGELLAARSRLAHLIYRGMGTQPLAQYLRMIAGARAAKRAAERALIEAGGDAEQVPRAVRAGFEEVRAALPPATALVAYSLYDHGALEGESRRGAGVALDSKYIAFVLRAGGSEVRILPLGCAARIDALVASWRTRVASGGGEAPEEAACRRVGAALRERIWDPLTAELEGVRSVFLVPDGALNLVNLGALPAGEERYLIETAPALHYLSAERDLVRLGKGEPAGGMGLLALGDPDFDASGALVPRRAEPARSRGTLRSGILDRAWLRWNRLPQARREVEELAASWRALARAGAAARASVYLGAEASEGRFRAEAPRALVLHLATHGFFLPPRDAGGDPDPLLLSGLVLAGANRRAQARSGERDGILSAEEIAGLDLSRVGWAVLSACGSGLGEVRASEGVFGLRRAFQIAGVRTLIMSLWPVDDAAAREWMGALYRARLEGGASTIQAVRAASLAVLRRRREQGQSTLPFYWAAFVASGGWR